MLQPSVSGVDQLVANVIHLSMRCVTPSEVLLKRPSSGVLRLPKRYFKTSSEVFESNDVDAILSFAIAQDGPKVTIKRETKYLYEPLGLYQEVFNYWSRSLRKATYLERKYGGCRELIAVLSQLLHITQKDLVMVHSTKMLCCQRAYPYLDKIYYPRRILVS